MHSLPITYWTYDKPSVQVTNTFWFNISRVEFIRMEAAAQKEGGWKAKIEKITKSDNNEEIFAFFEELVSKSYGIREDSEHFDKSEEIRKQFMKSAAYDELISMLAFQGEKFLGPFVEGILPREMVENAEIQKEVEKAIAAQQKEAEAVPTNPV